LLVVISTFSLLLSACSEEAFVDVVTIVNDTAYSATVDVTDEGRNGWLTLTKVGPRSTYSAEGVIDQGDVWIFRFDYAGKHQAELEVSRGDLRSNGWTVSVPESFEQSLRALDVPPPP
jgi:hypothetical protein